MMVKKGKHKKRIAEATRAAQDEHADKISRSGMGGIHDSYDKSVGRRADQQNPGRGMDVGRPEVSGSRALRSDLTGKTTRELEAILYAHEVERNVLLLREGKATIPLSSAAALYAVFLQGKVLSSASSAPHPPSPSGGATSVSSRVPTPSARSAMLSPTGVVSSSVPAAHSSPVVATAASSAFELVSRSPSESSPLATSPPDTASRQATSTRAVEVGKARSKVAPDRSQVTKDAFQVTVSPSDLPGLPLLTGQADQDASQILTHYHFLCKRKADAVSSDPDVADEVALRHVTLIGQGEVMTFIQQLLAGEVDFSREGDSLQPEVEGCFAPPRTWTEMRAALLDFLLPIDSVERGARAIATIKQDPDESVRAYDLRFRTLLARLEENVARERRNRTPWECVTAAIWENGLRPALDVRGGGGSAEVSQRGGRSRKPT